MLLQEVLINKNFKIKKKNFKKGALGNFSNILNLLYKCTRMIKFIKLKDKTYEPES